MLNGVIANGGTRSVGPYVGPYRARFRPGVALGDRSRFRGMGDWFEVVNGQVVWHQTDGTVSGTRPRIVDGGTPATGSTGGGGVSGNVAAILAAVNGLGTSFVQLWQQNNALKQQQFTAQYGAPGAAGGGANTGLTGLVNQLTTFASANPLLVAAGAVGIFLLMAPPPKRR